MEKYVIAVIDTDVTKGYLTSIYRNSISVDKDMGQALKINDLEQAKAIKNYLKERENEEDVFGGTKNYDYKLIKIKTVKEEVED